MSKPVFEDMFAFSGRRNRMSYFLLYLSWMTLAFVGVVLAVLLTPKGSESPGMVMLIGMLFIIPAGLSNLAASTQRCRDIGWTGWAILITAIPLVGAIFSLVLLFMPGTVGPNQYGPDPLRLGSDLDAKVFE
ncbi:DUF805 domain-containing protein [Neogemmobacter tilapiae]|uniref:Aminopeptidase n=1 Tax=Neogemmobacter tilapiae TaxID=875041 RepID=A0A918TJM6_9RHOB|nr:DUF805 domain-containing protein [Gemmobacter tilapiae]GHC48731.1 aminopeptidase [Gemmobacter tilapiae]